LKHLLHNLLHNVVAKMSGDGPRWGPRKLGRPVFDHNTRRAKRRQVPKPCFHQRHIGIMRASSAVEKRIVVVARKCDQRKNFASVRPDVHGRGQKGGRKRVQNVDWNTLHQLIHRNQSVVRAS
jgi:hypothetical protein